ncbi:MAG: MFS transporter [Methanocorpusculum sp.]|nr:MFS transporter [Methanocorpusculum sp.]MDE2523769.1 MFS transporter [Methanocorpusculum sp.]
MNVIESPVRQKLLLVAIAISVVMDSFDGSIVNVALPVMAADFGTDAETIAWVSITYFLMMAGLLMMFGKLAERGYIRKVFIGGFTIFIVGSAICGCSPDLFVLLGARLFQGIGAAMIAATAPMLCVLCLPGKILGLGLGVITMASSVGCAAGPAIGGILTHYLSWHWIFLINIPIGIIAIPFSLMVIPKKDCIVLKRSFDFAGAVFLFAMMIFGIYALECLPHLGIYHPQILISFVLAGLFALLFVVRELSCKTPIVNVRVFSLWRFDAVLAAYFIMNAVYTGALYLLPFYLLANMQFDIMTIGLFLFIPPVLTAILGIPIGKWSDRVGRRRFAIGACLALVAFNVIFAVILPEMGLIPLISALGLMGVVWGLAGGTAAGRIVENVPKGEQGTGSSLMVTSIYLGSVVGTALYAMLFTLATSQSGGVGAFQDLDPAQVLSGFHFAILIGLIPAVLSVILSVVVREQKMRGEK